MEVNISIPESESGFIATQMAAGGYETPSAFFLALLREEQKRATAASIDVMLREGLDSGAPLTVDKQFWDYKKKALQQRHRAMSGQ